MFLVKSVSIRYSYIYNQMIHDTFDSKDERLLEFWNDIEI